MLSPNSNTLYLSKTFKNLKKHILEAVWEMTCQVYPRVYEPQRWSSVPAPGEDARSSPSQRCRCKDSTSKESCC